MKSDSLKDIKNFLQISDRLGTAGKLEEGQFAWVRDAGYEAIVNLAMPEQTPGEAAIATALGMEYVSIPVIWTNPTLENLADFFEVMDARSHQKIFVHCMANMRVTAFVYLYRRVRQHVGAAEAMADVYPIWDPKDNAIWW